MKKYIVTLAEDEREALPYMIDNFNNSMNVVGHYNKFV